MFHYDYKTENTCSQLIAEKLSGVLCGRRPTSCADQLARAVRAACEAEQQAS